jgi:LemA protein
MTIALIVVAVLVVVVALMYNALVRDRVRVENAWAQIDVQLKRRIDLIPNLVETVKGYASHEQKTLDAVIQARNAASSAAASPAAQAQASDALSGALRQLFALSEAYPDLKANQNTSIQKFPTLFLARIGGFTAKEFFEADAADRVVPKVQF